MICTIHQPNFVPWLPYFDKMKRADVFVLLKHCQYEKGGFQNRFRLADEWYTMSVDRGLAPIVDKTYTDPVGDWERILSRLPAAQRRILEPCTEYVSDSLADTNTAIIQHLAARLGIGARLHFDTGGEGCASERLLNICLRLGCDTYLSGESGRRYLDEDMFNDAGVDVIYQVINDRRHSLEVLS